MSRRLQRIRLGLLANVLRWRAGSSAVFFVVALSAVAAATAGPIYLAAADQSVLAHVVVPPAPEATGLVVNEQPGQVVSEASLAKAVALGALSPSGLEFFGRPLLTAVAPAAIGSPSGAVAAVADLVARSGDCRELAFARGRCPVGGDEVAVSTRSAAYLHIGLGTVLSVSSGASSHDYRVSGLYRAGSASDPYWWGSDYFEFGTSQSPPPRMDALFTDFAAFARLPPHEVALGADLPVNTRQLLSTQLPAFRHALSAAELRLGKMGFLAASGIGSYLDDVASQQRAMTTTIAVIDLQLLLLVLMVLFGIAGRIAAERDQDLALANLRGLSPRSLWAVALREPFVLMLAAAPIGAGLGWLVALATARANLLAGTPVPFDSLALAAALAASLLALGATAAGSRRALARSVGRAGTSRSRLSVGFSLAGEAAVIALAVAAVVQVSASGVGTGARSQPLAALAPGLIALAVGVVAARAVPFACRLAARATRFSPRVALSLALQRVARQSGIIRQSVIVAIAVALACFAVAGYSIDKTNRAEEALFLVGANRVLTVTTPGTVDFEQAVREADPSRNEAMAVEVASNSQGTLLAVDTSAFAHVAAWASQPGAASAAAVARFLAPPVAPEVTVKGAELGLVVDMRAALSPPPSLSIAFYNEQYGASDSVNVGPLSPGRHRYTTSLEGYCVSVCRLQSVAASWSGTASSGEVTIPVDIEQISVGSGAHFTPVAAGLSQRGDWRVSASDPGLSTSLRTLPSGLLVSFRYVTGDSPPAVAPADVPEVLPAVVTNVVASVSGSGPTGSTQYSILNLDGSALNVNGAMQVAAIPSVGTNAVMVDLTDALRDESLPDIYSTKQVWLSSAAGSGATFAARLRREGVTIVSVRTARSIELAFEKDGPTLAFQLFLVVGAESALLATGSMLFAVAADARKRAVEAVALGAVGVPRGKLVGAMAGELGIVAATGLVAGTLAGVLAAHFSLSSVPEFTGLSPGPTLMFNLPVAWIALVVAGAAVLLALAVAISIALVGAASTPDKLRISQR